jgi:ribosome biogenesis GTPase / thiamine phosphate phosphatase
MPLNARALRALGWDDALAASLVECCPDGRPARVARVDRGGWLTVVGAEGQERARLHPRFRRPHDPLARPTVGDWVVLPPEAAAEPVVEVVLQRKSVLVRNAGGDDRDVSHPLAANVDTALLALPLDGDRNPRRTDRFVALARSGGVEPVLVLTKADRADPTLRAAAEAEAAGHGVAAHTVRARTGEGLEALEPYLAPGETVVLLGVSGAGKSTLVNALVGGDLHATAEVRRDGKGRHTTTHRVLVPLAGGGLLIDTPGLRSVAVWDEGAAKAFEDVEALAAGCRFSDCTHDHEPGCAVRAAVEVGDLEADRVASYRRLRVEEAALAARRRSRAGARRRRG